MKTIKLTFLFFLLTQVVFGQEIKNYDLHVKFDVPQRKIEVNGIINLYLDRQDSITLTLWKNTDIKSITIANKSVDFSFDKEGKSPIYYIPNGGKLILRHIAESQKPVAIHFAYSCNMENITNWAESFSEDWIQLGFYTAWYPVHINSKEFTSTIRISIDEGYKVSGSGLVTRDGNDWIITQNWSAFDNVIITAKDLKTKEIRKDKIALDLVYTSFPENDLDSLSVKCEEVYEFFSSIFGQPDDSYLKFVINPLEGGGGYGRPKYFSLKASAFNQYLKNGMAHEMSHFWWHNAETTTWEDWLNEAFAECSMLLYIREKDNKQEYNKSIVQYKKWIVNSIPIWGIDREAPEAYNALYNKGSLILLEFEEKIGTKKFFNFLKMVYNKKISTTADFLDLIEFEYTKEYRHWFENKLTM
jgi:hypothetical protein